MAVYPGEELWKDPSAKLTHAFKWADWLGVAEIASYVLTVSGADNALTHDQDSRTNGNQWVSFRLLGGTVGLRYTVTCHIVTNETPPQEDDRLIYIKIRNQ